MTLAPPSWQYDGVFLSNGPGDPTMCSATVKSARWCLSRPNPEVCLVPRFGLSWAGRALANFALSPAAKKNRRLIHRAAEQMESVLNAKGSDSAVNKKVSRLVVEVDNQPVVSIFKDDLKWKPAAGAHFDESAKEEIYTHAHS